MNDASERARGSDDDVAGVVVVMCSWVGVCEV